MGELLPREWAREEYNLCMINLSSSTSASSFVFKCFVNAECFFSSSRTGGVDGEHCSVVGERWGCRRDGGVMDGDWQHMMSLDRRENIAERGRTAYRFGRRSCRKRKERKPKCQAKDKCCAEASKMPTIHTT